MRRRDLPGGIAPPTKTELKRQARAVQALADRLVAAPAELVERLVLPDKLADAVALARRIPGGGALVRQRQFVATFQTIGPWGLPLLNTLLLLASGVTITIAHHALVRASAARCCSGWVRRWR